MKYLIVMNKMTNVSDPIHYISNETYIEIEDMAKETFVDYEIVTSKYQLYKCYEKVSSKRLIKVLNLTQHGLDDSSVYSYCFLKGIEYIGTNAKTHMLCKFRKIKFKDGDLNLNLKTISYKELQSNDYAKNENYIIKQINSSKSVQINNVIGKIKLQHDIFKINNIVLNEDFFRENILLEYKDGIKLEVPFFIKLGVVLPLGYYTKCKTAKSFDTVEGIDKDYIRSTISKIVYGLRISHYGKIAFNIENINDIKSYKVEFVDTMPSFVEGSSFRYAFDNNEELSKKYVNVLSFIFSLKN